MTDPSPHRCGFPSRNTSTSTPSGLPRSRTWWTPIWRRPCRPSEITDVVDAYLEAALEAGFREVRLIHGRGKGVQRAQVQRMLARDPRVERFTDAPPGRGGWGATLVWLRTPELSA